MGVLVLITIILLISLSFLCLPISYRLTLYIGSPFHIMGNCTWLGRMFSYTWKYTYGERPQIEWYVRGKKKDAAMQAPEEDTPMTPEQQEAMAQEIEQENKAITYDDVNTIDEPDSSMDSFRWKPLVFNEAFGLSFVTWLQHILYACRIRTFSAAGSLGLTQPHQTGILAGALYAIIPAGIENLRFNFIEEVYDCTIHSAGRLYPITILFYSIVFLLSRPVRQLMTQWYLSKKGAHHG